MDLLKNKFQLKLKDFTNLAYELSERQNRINSNRNLLSESTKNLNEHDFEELFKRVKPVNEIVPLIVVDKGQHIIL